MSMLIRGRVKAKNGGGRIWGGGGRSATEVNIIGGRRRGKSRGRKDRSPT